MINLGFWEKIEKPIFSLAPMADVTDFAFRKIITKYGKPDVFWTEFVAADGLTSLKGRKNLLINLKFNKKQKPIVAQIFGGKKENIGQAVKLCRELGFDGIDLNMGCPDKTIEKQKAGSYMMKDFILAKKIIEEAKKYAENIPISVKTRIGYNKEEIDTWIRFLLEQNIAVLTVHLRTRKEMSKVPARWDLMKKIIKIRNELCKETLVFGNGDVKSLEDAREKVEKYKCDGVMLGRAIFGNPWLFAGLHKGSFFPSVKGKLKILIEHTNFYEKYLIKKNKIAPKNFAIMKKHFKAYVNGFSGSKELRVELMRTNNAKEVKKIIKKFIKKQKIKF